MIVNIVSYLLGAGALAGAFWWTRRSARRLERENVRIEQEKQVVVDFMHIMATALDDKPTREQLMQRIVRASLASTGAMSACLYERVAADQLRGAAMEGLFPPQGPVPELSHGKLATRARFLESVLHSETLTVGKGLIGEVAATGRAALIIDASRDPRIYQHGDPALRIRSLMAVPLRFNQRCFGVLALANPADRQPFGETEFELMKWLGEQAALALHNADYLNLHVERQQLDLDLELASSVQQMILPGRAPSVPGLDIDLRYAAAQKVGGDLYDLFELPDGRLGVAIADVSGKGIPASLLMAICRSYLRLIAPRHSSPAAALRELNAAMQGDVQPGSFVTLIYCIVDPLTGSLTFARAGHELPLLARCREGLGARCVVAYVESEGMPVGLVPSEVFDSMIEDFSTEFDEGDIFLLYTDGITEAPNEEDKEYSGARLADVLRNAQGRAAKEINDRVLESVARFVGGTPQRDDYTLVSIRCR